MAMSQRPLPLRAADRLYLDGQWVSSSSGPAFAVVEAATPGHVFVAS